MRLAQFAVGDWVGVRDKDGWGGVGQGVEKGWEERGRGRVQRWVGGRGGKGTRVGG